GFGPVLGPIAMGLHIVLYVFLNASINGAAHWIGYQRFKNSARNMWVLALLTGGEGLHNNHHEFPGSSRFAQRWWEVDLGWYVIALLRSLGLARPAPSVALGPISDPAQSGRYPARRRSGASPLSINEPGTLAIGSSRSAERTAHVDTLRVVSPRVSAAHRSAVPYRIAQEILPNSVGRVGRVDDVPYAVAFLVSPLAGFINGAKPADRRRQCAKRELSRLPMQVEKPRAARNRFPRTRAPHPPARASATSPPEPEVPVSCAGRAAQPKKPRLRVGAPASSALEPIARTSLARLSSAAPWVASHRSSSR